MSIFWTEELVSTVKQTYIKGTFTGKYYAEHEDEWSQSHSEFYHMHIYQAEITLEEVRKGDEGDFPEAYGLRSFKGTFGQPVTCYDPGAPAYFQLNLEEPRISDPAISKVSKDGSQHFGTISGTIYGHIIKLVNETVRTEHQLPASVPLSPRKADEPVANDWQGWSRTTTHQFSYTDGFRYRRDYYRHVNGHHKWGSWYAVEQGWSVLSGIKLVFGCCFAVFLLFLLISLSWPGLLVMGFILLIVIIARVRRRGFGQTFFSFFYGLICLVYFGGIAIAVFRGLGSGHAAVEPVHQNGIHDFTRTQPVKQKRRAPGSRDGSGDEWIVHHRVWQDQEGHEYEGDVRVLRSLYLRSAAEHAGLNGVTGLPDVYRAMTLADSPRLAGVYPLFDSLRRVNELDSGRFAQMLVGFVQDIPYTAVTEGECNNAGEQNLSGAYGSAAYHCIGNIPYGVQSPVEFMANFEGDCDTRTLFLFTLFNHYHYHVAILGSNAFRHSLLGLSLPLPGSAKMAGTERYVLWETTSRGFAAGHLSPEIDQMVYWDFNLINTNSL